MRPNIRDIKHITSDTVLKSCDSWAFINDRVITIIPSDMLTVVGEPGFVCLRSTEEHGVVRVQTYSPVPGKKCYPCGDKEEEGIQPEMWPYAEGEEIIGNKYEDFDDFWYRYNDIVLQEIDTPSGPEWCFPAPRQKDDWYVWVWERKETE